MSSAGMDFGPALRRRSFLVGAGALASTTFLHIDSSAAMIKEHDLFPIVETAQGRVRGLDSGGIKVFRGIPYGADTAGANRWLPPQPVKPWAGVRDATACGNYAPQMPIDRRRGYADLIMYDVAAGGMGEDCLSVNVWSPSLSGSAKKPVIVILHGGGYYGGSGNAPGTDGEQMARFGDVVFVSVNHRLGSFGFAHLAELGGERYAQSGMNGMLDAVAALRWVRENIAAFGGDPSRVLVFGQSGGGAKTSVLMAMPSAKGLFHRAGVMSGSALRVGTNESGAAGARAFLKHLELDPKGGLATIEKMQKMPMHQLLTAQIAMEMADRAQGEAPRSFVPVVDGTALPRQPFDPDAPAVSSDVPMIIGTVLDERAYRMGSFDLDEAGLQAFAKARLGADAEKVLAMYREEDPKASPYLISARIDTDNSFRKAAHVQALRKAEQAAQGGAPVFAYLWKAPSPAYGGRYGAVHGVDVGPSLHDSRLGLNGPDPQRMKLADQIASAWASFAATGTPVNPRLPAWAPHTTAGRETLVFQADAAHTAVEKDPRSAIRAYWAGR